MYKEGMYQFIKQADHPDGGFVKFLNDTWPDLTRKENARRYAPKNVYGFVLDGRIRSPWYDIESKKLGVQKTRCELDCSFSGSGGEVLDPERIRDLEIIAKTKKPINLLRGGLWKSYKVFFEPVKDHMDLDNMEESIKAHRYIVVCDTATGDGSDFSAFCVIDLDTMEVVATFKEQLDPKNYAHIIAEVATTYNKALVIIEYQEGLTTLLELRDVVKYKNVFYSTLKKQDVTKVQKRKIGFWQSESTRTLGGDKLEEVLNTGELKVYSMDVIGELYTWVWDKKGRRSHASEKHDDLLMSLTIGMFFIYYVLTRRDLNREFFRKHIGRTVQSAMVGTSNRLSSGAARNDQDDEEMFDPEFRVPTRQ
jgi:hypothetical protein